MKAWVPKSVGETSSDSLTVMTAKIPERMIYATAGVRVAVIGHTIAGVATCTSFLIATA